MSEKKNRGYLTGKEIRAIAKENAKHIRRLEAYKNRKADESEFTTQMANDENILEIQDLHTYFYTEQGVVKAVNGVSYAVPKNKVVGVVGESGCGKSVTSMSVMRLIQGPAGQIDSGSIRFQAKDYKRNAKGDPIADENGEMVFLSKENDSNGCIGTVDVSYPSIPLMLMYNPELVRALCRPILRFANMPVWKGDFAPHDVGRYPNATVTVDARCTASFDKALNEKVLDVLEGLQVRVTGR